ncbi:MAG: hypothetical protein ACE10G_13330 [Gemmatimonadales bacterium]
MNHTRAGRIVPICRSAGQIRDLLRGQDFRRLLGLYERTGNADAIRK